MRQNMSGADRIIRFIIAAVIGFLYFSNYITGTWGVVLLAVAIILLLTSITGFCPLYGLFRINKQKQ